MNRQAWRDLQRSIPACDRCPRLRSHCQQVAREKRKAFLDQDYWGQPVPNFGTSPARLLVIGLAPAAHGANRTGRMFTGDRSGEWLFRAMHQHGFANQATASDRRDGLKLIDAVVTSVVHCAPPGNRPTPEELNQCLPYTVNTISLTQPSVLVALGGIAWNATLRVMAEQGWWQRPKRRPAFGHRNTVELNSRQWLIGSYHPSQQNTFTGRLTEPMLSEVFHEARRLIEAR